MSFLRLFFMQRNLILIPSIALIKFAWLHLIINKLEKSSFQRNIYDKVKSVFTLGNKN